MLPGVLFRDRIDAGHWLARALQPQIQPPIHVMGLARGGAIVGSQVARELGATFDVIVTRRLGLPEEPETTLGAISESGGFFVDAKLLVLAGITQQVLHEEIEWERREVDRRVRLYRSGRALTSLRGETVILVDDGLMSGATARAALDTLGRLQPARVMLAVPVASLDALRTLRPAVSVIICPGAKPSLRAISDAYLDFPRPTDEDVLHAIQRVAGEEASRGL